MRSPPDETASRLGAIGPDVGGEQGQIDQVTLRTTPPNANRLRKRAFERVDRVGPASGDICRETIRDPDDNLSRRVTPVGDALPYLVRISSERLGVALDDAGEHAVGIGKRDAGMRKMTQRMIVHLVPQKLGARLTG